MLTAFQGLEVIDQMGEQFASIGHRSAIYDVAKDDVFEGMDSRSAVVAASGAGSGVFTPPPITITPSNPVQNVRVLVLNFEPTVPSLNNQRLWEIFPSWNDPNLLASEFIADIETASGGAIDYEIVEWRDLNEFPIFEDGFRYTAEDYVAGRQNGTLSITTPIDFEAVAKQQQLAELVNNNVIDEIWMFGDHYFNLLGEDWMAGPESFFINGPSFPEFSVDRAVAGFSFSYERGVAEMMHNLGHRTENHMRRLYGGWDLVNPTTPWDLFSSSEGTTSAPSYGVGHTHFPFNGAVDYDYSNTRTFDSFADDFVQNFPNQTYATTPMSRDAWGDLGSGDWERGYQRWFFGHLPRETGADVDGRQNNWYKSIYDFNSYRPDTGAARDKEAILGAPPLENAGEVDYEFSLRFYDAQGIDTTTLDNADLLVTGPGGYSQLATLNDVGSQQSTTAGTARTVRYRVTASSGVWDPADSGTYTVSLQASQVRDTAGVYLPSAQLGSFRVNPVDSSRLNVASLLTLGQASVSASSWDIGDPNAIFDANTSSLYRTASVNPAVVTLSFTELQTVAGFQAYFSHAGGDPSYQWKVESANSLADLDSKTGSYQELVPNQGTPSDVFSNVTLNSPVTARHFRLTAERLTGDDFVHINSWELIVPEVVDIAAPSATLLTAPSAFTAATSTSFTVRYSDDQTLDIRTMNFGDIRVTGPNGFEQTAAFYGLDVNANGPTRDATYFISPPGGKWDGGDSGIYVVEMLPQQVADEAGKPVATGVLGSFQFVTENADFDSDGDVDGFDFLAWQRGFGTTAPNAEKGDGDADDDFDVDGTDLTVWENQFGSGAPTVSMATASGEEVDVGTAPNLFQPTNNSRLTSNNSRLSPDLVDRAVTLDEKLLDELFTEDEFHSLL